MLQFFENQTCRTLAHHEAVARAAERTRCGLGTVVAGRQCVHGVESANTSRKDGCFGSSGYDCIGHAEAYVVEGVD